MVALRLQRVGKKNHVTFRLVASDKRKDTVGPALEILGSFDPHQTPSKIAFKGDRVKYWLSVGAQPSDSVHNLLIEAGIMTGDKRVIAKAAQAEAPVAEAKPDEAPAATPAESATETTA